MACAIYGRLRADRNPPGESLRAQQSSAGRRRIKPDRRRCTPRLTRRAASRLRIER